MATFLHNPGENMEGRKSFPQPKETLFFRAGVLCEEQCSPNSRQLQRLCVLRCPSIPAQSVMWGTSLLSVPKTRRLLTPGRGCPSFPCWDWGFQISDIIPYQANLSRAFVLQLHLLIINIQNAAGHHAMSLTHTDDAKVCC